MFCKRHLVVNVGEPEFLLVDEKKDPVRCSKELAFVRCYL